MVASGIFDAGRNMRLYPSSLASMVAGRAHWTHRTAPSSASSPRKSDDVMSSSRNAISFPRMPRAIGRSYIGHFFLRSAGARLTVIRAPQGNLYPEFLMALRTRSRLSWMAVSPSQTMVNCHIPVTTSTSISTRFPIIPYIEAEKSFCISLNIIAIIA